MGDTIIVSAKVRRSNVYRLSVYDNNSDLLVFQDVGAVNGSDVNVSMPIHPPAFNASRVYSLSFDAGLVNYPLLGVVSHDSSATPFTVVNSLTRLNLSARYDGATHELQSAAFLTTSDGVPVANRTVSFYMQPNVDFVKPDRGWTLLDSVQTDANGSASYSLALSMMGGRHGLEARFVGDQDFGSSCADTQFNVSYRPTMLRVVKASKTASTISVILQLSEPSGLPLGGKVLRFEAVNVTAGPLYAVTNDTGCAILNFSGPVQSYVDSKITVLGDDYISRYETFVRLVQNGSGMSVASNWGESGLGSFATGAESKRSIYTTAFSARPTQTLSSPPNDVTVTAYPNASACVDLPETIDSSLVLNSSAGALTFSFYINGTCKGSDSATLTRCYSDGQWWYVYNASFLWYPDVIGSYSVDVLANETDTNSTIGEGNVAVSVGRAYCNLVVYYLGAFAGDNMTLVVAFSKARTQDQTDGSGYFQTVNFAPTISWNNSAYSLDQATQAPTIHLYVNGQRTDLNDTSGTGVCSLSLNSSGLPCLNVTAAIDQNDRFRGNDISQVFNLTRVSVLDDPTVAANPQAFYMNYSMSVLNGTDITYVNSGNVVQTQVTVLNRSACNVPAFFMAGVLGTRVATNASGFLTIPPSSNYTRLRAVSASNFSNSTILNPWTDINRDRKVDMKDVGIVAKAYNTKLGNATYNWTCDVNADGKVDMADVGAVSRDFGNSVNYLPNGAYSPNLDYRGIRVDSNAGRVYMDSRGFASIPSGTTWLNLSCKADVEFFSYVFNASAATDNGGRASVTWNASLQGQYDACLYVAEVSLTSPLNLTVAVDNATSPMNASLRTANYYYVFKRPVDVSLSWDSQQQSTVSSDVADTYVLQNDNSIHGGETTILVYAQQGYQEDIGFVRFDLSALPVGAIILSARLNVYTCYGGCGTGANFTAYRVLGPWNEQTLNWFNMPDLNPNPSCATCFPQQEHIWFSFDVTGDVHYWSSNPSLNYGLALRADPANPAIRWLCSRRWSPGSCSPSLQICYLTGSQDVSINAYDEALQCPTQVNVSFSVNGTVNGSGTTNQSGVWDRGTWHPFTGGVYNLGAVSTATQECASGSTSCVFRLGLPTSMVSLDNNSSVSKGWIVSNFSLCSSSLFNVGGKTVNFCVNGTYGNGTVYAGCSGSNTTLSNGRVSFNWYAGDIGAFSVHAFFGGDADYLSCDGYALVNVSTLPLSVLFTVCPDEFVPGAPVTLNATIMDPLTNTVFSHNVYVKFTDFASDGSKTTLACISSSESILYTLPNGYPNDNRSHAYSAVIVNCTDPGVASTVSNLASSPVQLTVGCNTTLSLNVWNTSSPSQYLVGGSLKEGSQGVLGRQITLNINDTKLAAITGVGGSFGVTRDFPAVNNAPTTYTITASFNGEDPLSASATATAPDGTSYAACTTTQFSLKPSSNSTVLAVTPQSTQATMLAKTPEEIQQEAKDKGVLSIRSEFSWWYPWFKTVGEVTLNLLSGTVVFRSELVPLAFSQTTTVKSGADSLIQELRTSFRKVGVEAVVSYIVAIVSAKLVAWVFGSSSLVGLLVAIVTYAAVTLAATYVLNSVFGRDGLLVGVIAFFMSLSIDLVIGWAHGETGFLYSFVRGIYVGASTGSITSMWHSWWGSSMNFFNIISTAAFYLVDLGLGAGLASSL
jgi:hypothetical protein